MMSEQRTGKCPKTTSGKHYFLYKRIIKILGITVSEEEFAEPKCKYCGIVKA